MKPEFQRYVFNSLIQKKVHENYKLFCTDYRQQLYKEKIHDILQLLYVIC